MAHSIGKSELQPSAQFGQQLQELLSPLCKCFQGQHLQLPLQGS